MFSLISIVEAWCCSKLVYTNQLKNLNVKGGLKIKNLIEA